MAILEFFLTHFRNRQQREVAAADGDLSKEWSFWMKKKEISFFAAKKKIVDKPRSTGLGLHAERPWTGSWKSALRDRLQGSSTRIRRWHTTHHRVF
jgi:hypothetical protein